MRPGPLIPNRYHLQFGADASREVTVSWATPTSVRRPRLRLSMRSGGGRTVQAETCTYADAQSGVEIFTHHALLTDLKAAPTPSLQNLLHMFEQTLLAPSTVYQFDAGR
jgi:hypothetical protein